MGMTMTQKILAAHAGLDSVKPGQLIRAKLDMVLGNDVTTPVPLRSLRRQALTRFLIRIRYLLSLTTSLPTRTLSPQSTVRCAVNLQVKRTLPISMT